MSQLNRETLRKLILMEIRKVLQEQQIDTSSNAAAKYIEERQKIMKKPDSDSKKQELTDLKKRMGVQRVENITDNEGNIIQEKVIFVNQEEGPSAIVSAKFEEEEDQS